MDRIETEHGIFTNNEETGQTAEEVYQEWENNRNKLMINQEITQKKKQLEETDYKIIKCSEYQLAGLELPYNIAELHTDRQAIRDRINELEVAD